MLMRQSKIDKCCCWWKTLAWRKTSSYILLLCYAAATSLSGARADFYLVFGSEFHEVSGADFEKATMQSPQYPRRRTFRPEPCTQKATLNAHIRDTCGEQVDEGGEREERTYSRTRAEEECSRTRAHVHRMQRRRLYSSGRLLRRNYVWNSS